MQVYSIKSRFYPQMKHYVEGYWWFVICSLSSTFLSTRNRSLLLYHVFLLIQVQ